MTRAAATSFLLDLLRDGPISATEGEAAAQAAGIGSRTLDRARRELGVIAFRFERGWSWGLAEEADAKDATAPAKDAITSRKDAK